VEDLDNAMEVQEAYEAREHKGYVQRDNGHSKAHIGTVEHFFDKINVVAIKLIGPLKVGDIIEIGDEENAVRQKILSMQIDREDVQSADEGDSIGIKLDHRVAQGSHVYRIR